MLSGLAKTGLILASFRVVGAGLVFLTTIILTRILTPAEFGFYTYIVIAVMIGQLVVTNGAGAMVMRNTSRSRVDQQWSQSKSLAKCGNWLAVIISVILFAVAVTVSAAIDSAELSLSIIFLACIIMLTDQWSALRISILRGLDKLLIAQIPETLFRPGLFCLLLLGILVAHGSADVETVLVCSAIAVLMSFALGQWLLNRNLPDAYREAPFVNDYRKWMTTGLPFVGSGAVTMLNHHIDLLVLGLFVSLAEAGNYRVAFQFSLLSGLAFASLNLIANPRFAFLFKAGDMAGLQRSASLMSAMAFVCALALPLFMYVFGEELIRILFGPAYVGAWKPMLILLLVPVIDGLFGMSRALLMMADSEHSEFKLSLASLLLNLVLCLLLVPHMGLEGAAWSVVIATIARAGSHWYLGMKRVGINSSFLGLLFSRA